MSKAGGIQYLLKHGKAASPVTTRTTMPSVKPKKMASGGISSLSPTSKYDALTEAQLAAFPNEYRDALDKYAAANKLAADAVGKAYFYDPASQRFTLAKPIAQQAAAATTTPNKPYVDNSGPGGYGGAIGTVDSYGGGYTGPGGTTSPTGGGIAANPMGIDPATAQGQGLGGAPAPGSTSGGTIGGVAIGALGDPASTAAAAAAAAAAAEANGAAAVGAAESGAPGGDLAKGGRVKKMATGGISALAKSSPYDYLTADELAKLPNWYRDAISGHPDTGGMSYFYDPASQRYTPSSGSGLGKGSGVSGLETPEEILAKLKRTQARIALESGNGDVDTDPSGWGSMSPAEQASFYGEHPNFAAVTQLGQQLFGYTTLGALQKALVPSFVEQQAMIARGINPETGMPAGYGNAAPSGFSGDSDLGPDGTEGEAEAAANAAAVNAAAQADVEAAVAANAEANAAAAAAEGEASLGGGGVDSMAAGGITALARGGMSGTLGGYSDGGQLLRGPGDGVSDSIPARIGQRQPARLADGEFVVPARIVSELGNGSTEAGSRKLYAMMERIQQGRKKTMKGKSGYAKDTKADKHLPA